jgi:hypothetical protein
LGSGVNRNWPPWKSVQARRFDVRVGSPFLQGRGIRGHGKFEAVGARPKLGSVQRMHRWRTRNTALRPNHCPAFRHEWDRRCQHGRSTPPVEESPNKSGGLRWGEMLGPFDTRSKDKQDRGVKPGPRYRTAGASAREAQCSSESGQGERRCQEEADHAFESERQECGPQQPGGQAGNPHSAGAFRKSPPMQIAE